jgi:hypothetical protein
MDRTKFSRILRINTLAILILLGTKAPCSAQIRVSGGGSTVGYIDGAPLADQVRVRFDAAYGNHRPGRADFFWARAGLPETSVDDQEMQAYLETLLCPRTSLFLEGGARILNPERNENTSGLGDICLGLKFAVAECDAAIATLQLRVYLPTGDLERGLGNGHCTLEPSVLLMVPVAERLTLEAELRYWAPIDGTTFAGSILRYGLGMSYLAYESCQCTIRPVVEFVGWSVLDGQATVVGPTGQASVEDASGDTIVNVKLGVRSQFGSHELYAGYGRPLSGDRWYEHVWRLEWRVRF